MRKFSVEQAANGYGIWVNFADNVDLVGLHVFATKEELMKFIEQHLV